MAGRSGLHPRARPRLLRIGALLLAAGLFHGQTRAEEERPSGQRLSIDPHLSVETGSDLTSTLVSGLGGIEERAFRRFRDRPAAGATVRAFRTLLLDAPVAYWFAVAEHEIFGHGGRAREHGRHAGFHLGWPWEGRTSYATFDGEGLSAEALLRIYAGGSESNGWTATLLEREIVASPVTSPLTLLFLAASRTVVSDYVLRTTPDPRRDPQGFYREWSGGGDVANYLGLLNVHFNGEPGIAPDGVSPEVLAQWRRLRRQAHWNALDPGMWLSLFAVGRSVLDGEEPARVPLPRIGDRRFLPILTADWLPDGGVISVEAVFSAKRGADTRGRARWWSATLRRGRGPTGGFGAAGLASERLWGGDRWRMGGEAEAWIRPGQGLGGGVRARVVWSGFRMGGLFVEAGVKSAGHWPGRPLAVGPMVRVGLALGEGAGP